MKVLYGIPTTGYGHVTRSKTIIDQLEKVADIDILLSGTNFGMEDSIGFKNIKFRKKGFVFGFDNKGRFKLTETIFQNQLHSLVKDALDLDLAPYDLIISDSEPLVSVTSKLQKKKCIGISNIYSYMNEEYLRFNTIAEPFRKFFLRILGGDENIVVFYDKLGPSYSEPVISKKFMELKSKVNEGDHFTVYLGTPSIEFLTETFSKLDKYTFEIFSPKLEKEYTLSNLKFVNSTPDVFAASVASSRGLITAAGFTATSEALYLGKKMLIIPINHVEQSYNARYLESLGVKVLHEIEDSFGEHFEDWVSNYEPIVKNYEDAVPAIINHIQEFVERPEPKRPHFSLKSLDVKEIISNYGPFKLN